MSERQTILDRFRERLAESLAAQPQSHSAFAREAGIDRSTLSQLLSHQNRRLPRVETLASISRATGASVDWLLGMSNDGPARTDIVREELSLARGQLTPFDQSLITWYSESIGQKVRYVPASLPDLLKTEPVFRHEFRRFESTYPEQRIETSEAPLEMARAPGSDVECCCAIQMLEGFARGQGVWASLEHRHRVDQLDKMIDLTEELYPTLRWFLFDSRQRYAGAVTIFGLSRAVVYLGQLHLVLTNENHVVSFVEQFDDLVRSAVVQPPDVPGLLRRLRAEVA
jgi:transcriptional regulator with XRE-family HTH domain